MAHRISEERAGRQATLDLVALLNNDLSSEQAHRMADRQAADPCYRKELQEVGELLSDLEPLAGSAVVQSILSSPVKRRRRPAVAMAACMLVAVAAGWWLFQQAALDPTVAVDRYVTRVGEQREVSLGDGSTITLNTNSEVLVALSQDQRQLTLKRGEVFFEVARQPERPFTVDIGDRTITVLGTSFNVLAEPGLLSVDVVEGKVAVHKSQEALDKKLPTTAVSGDLPKVFNSYVQHHLVAGQSVAINTDHQTSVLSNAANTGEWRSGFLSFSKVPLYKVVKQLNRYSAKKILIEDSSLMDLPISATVKINRINAMLRGLQASQNISVKHFADRIVLVGGD